MATSTRSSAQCSVSSEAMRAGELFGHVLLDQLRALDAEVRAGAVARKHTEPSSRHSSAHRRGIAAHRALDVQVRALVLEQPVARVAQQAGRLKHRRVLHGCRDAIVERLDLRPDVAHREHLARDACRRARWRPGRAPVSSCARTGNTGPMRLIRLLVIAVAMISRRRRWRFKRAAKRCCTGAGK